MKNNQGFINGEADWEVFFQCPVSRTCTIGLCHTGDITEDGIDRLIEMLNLVKADFAEPEKSLVDSIVEPDPAAAALYREGDIEKFFGCDPGFTSELAIDEYFAEARARDEK